jgi:hypothetical protein
MGQMISPARVLIVAYQTADSLELRAAVADRAAQGPCAFTLMVPASPRGVLAEAHRRLDAALPVLSTIAESEVVGIVGSYDPLAAVQDALNLLGFDEVIVSMLPARISRWLRLDLPRKVRALGVPVTAVVGTEVTPMPVA